MTRKRRNKDLELVKIQKSLKALMKVNKETYDTLGEVLSISPATIKRRLNGDQLTTTDLTELANALGVSFYELIEMSKSEGSQIHEFTEDQEKILSSDLNFIHVFRMALMGKSLAHIGKRLAVPEGRLRDILRKLENVGLLQLRVQDRIVPIAKFPFKWRPGGQLDRVYNRFLVENLFKRISKASGTELNRKFEIALTPDQHVNFCNEINRVYEKYRGFSQTLLESGIDENSLTSGILFVGRFSCWET